MSPRDSQLGKRPAIGPSSRNEVKRRRTWADKIVERQSANGIEEDMHRVAQRQKQIDLGKDTLAYDCFVSTVSREERKPQHPMTPLATQRCSRRSFVGQVKRWRKMLFDFKVNADSANAVKSGDGNTESILRSGERSFGACQENQEDALPVCAGVSAKESAGPSALKALISDAEHASPRNASTHVSSDADTPVCANDWCDFEEDDGVVLDDFGNLISMTPANNAASAVQCVDERDVEFSSELAQERM